jgi:tRNA-2-methylthio-N6-dimethylallyladenosine synthase
VFSPRPGTPAAEMSDALVPPEVAQERMRQLVEVVERHALRRHQTRVGRVEEVLVDGPSKKDPSVLSGRTRQNKLVHFAATDGAGDPGTLVEVRIVDAAPHWLRGEVERVVESPRRTKTRIPVAAV